MTIKHYLLILLIMALFGSAFVFGKLVLNTDVPPLLFGSLRMLVVVICLLPFFNFKIPEENLKSLFIFSFSMFLSTKISIKIFSILLLVLLFSCLSVGLFGSYVVGWWHGFQLFDERIQYQNCILDEESVSLCLEPGVYDDYIEKNKPILDELKLGPLADGLKYNDHSNDPLQAFLHTNIVGKPLMINLVDYSQKKSDGTIWNDPHNVILNYNTSLQIDLQREFFENEIQLGLDSNDTYSIQFYNGEQFLGREILYTDNNSENIKNYNLQVSEKISKNGYDTIKIQPLSGDNRFSFSHIILE